MAKKAVASLQTGSKRLTKAIKMVKSPKTGAYTFTEAIMAPEMVNDWLNKKNNQLKILKKSHFFAKVAFCIFVPLTSSLERTKGVLKIFLISLNTEH